MAVQHSHGELWFRTSSNRQNRNDLRDENHNYKDGVAHMASITIPGSGTSSLVVDGYQKATVSSSVPDTQNAPVRIGAGGGSSANRFFHGDIGEIIIYNRALTAQERQDVQIYLGKKWLGMYADNYFCITAEANEGGTIVPSGDIEVPEGGSSTFTITANEPFYEIEDVKVDGNSVGVVSKYTFENINDDHTIEAFFRALDPELTITATAGDNGSISDENGTTSETEFVVEKYAGQSHTFYFSPTGNYGVSDVIVNDDSKGPMSSYTISNIQENTTIHVDFAKTDPIIHLDASEISVNNGDAIATWHDLSDYGNHANQGDNSSRQPILIEDGLNGRQVVRFDGQDDFMQITNTTNLDTEQLTMFAVYRNTPKESYPNNAIGVITSKSRGHSNRSWWLVLNYNFTAGGTEAGIDPGALWFRTSSGGSLGNNLYHNGVDQQYINGDAYMVSVVVPPTAPGAQSVMYIDGEPVDPTTEASPIDHAETQVFRIGAGTTSGGSTERFFGGDLAELIIYNRALSEEEREAIELSLNAKWFGPQTPEITTWPTATDITYGEALSESVLDGGEASVDGTFGFKDAEYVPIEAGTKTVEVVFTPEDQESWKSVEGIINITINKKNLTIKAGDKTKIFDGTAFSDFSVTYDGFITDEDEAVLSGTLTFGGDAADATNAGTYTITPAGLTSNNYEITFEDGELTIEKADADITIDGYSGVYDGNAYGATLASALGVNDEDLTEHVIIGEVTYTDVPGGEVNWSFEHTNYESQSGTAAIIIEKAEQIIAWAQPQSIIYGTPLSDTQLNATVTAPGEVHGQVTYNPASGEELPVGTHTLEVSVAETENLFSATATVELVVDKAELTVLANDITRQYSDPNPELTYEIIGFVFGETLESTDVSGAPNLSTEDDLLSAPGEYPIVVEKGTLEASNYRFELVNGTLTITPEDAVITYIGDRMMAVNSNGEATFELRAIIEDMDDGYPGDIINATVDFIIYENGEEVERHELNIEDNDLVTSQKAIVSAMFTASLNEEESRTFEIQIEAGGYYQGELADPVVIVLYNPSGDHVTGGGYIMAGDPNNVAVVEATPGSKTNFGFNIKYHPKKNELQGNMNMIIRGESNPPMQFNSNEPIALGVNTYDPENKTAQFSFRGNLMQANNILYENLVLHVTLTDRGNPGHNDDIGFTLWNGNQLIYSSNWNGSYTNRINLSGGNLVIHNGGFDAEDVEIKIDSRPGENMNNNISEASEEVRVSVFPNPFRQLVNIRFTPESDKRAILELYDINGALVKTLLNKQVKANQSYQVEYMPGESQAQVLLYRLTLGNKVIQGKIIRQN